MSQRPGQGAAAADADTELVVLGGYLGSGKTTLLNRILADSPQLRTVAVVNDFGAINVDARLVSAPELETVDLVEGCVCCSLGDDAGAALRQLARRTDVDRVILEVSGVGDPAKLGSWRSYPGFRPGPVITCADATAISRLANDRFVGDAVLGQLQAAEVVVLTKEDLASERQLSRSQDLIATRAHQAQSISIPELLQRLAAGHSSSERPTAEPQTSSADGHGHQSVALTGSGPVEVAAIEAVLAAAPAGLVRAKGLLADGQGSVELHRTPGGDLQLTRGRGPVGDSVLVLLAAGPDAPTILGELTSQLAGTGLTSFSPPTGPAPSSAAQPTEQECQHAHAH